MVIFGDVTKSKDPEMMDSCGNACPDVPFGDVTNIHKPTIMK
jgi:hypothetical protein